ncbi:MAG: hypothetical protein OXI83_03715 [Gemmatimonadota bacterium]|nr:hypothetical protein [Gemmatimonadota bacterium]
MSARLSKMQEQQLAIAESVPRVTVQSESTGPDLTEEQRTGRVADPRRARRCCGGRSIAHRPWRRTRCRYDAADLSAGFNSRGFVVVMYRRTRRRTTGPVTDVRHLCQHGRWIGGLRFDGALMMGSGVENGVAEQGNPVWVFRSEREADRMVQRLRAGLPVFRDRWLALGAFVLVAAAVAEAVTSVLALL